ncbi:MAG: hypothetical protein PWQ14_323 [Rikenellaceae bacterium]|jgi:uncharacterized protein (UPF0332 family)|nr:hypothetical protein [Rikenellaceae bacterium]
MESKIDKYKLDIQQLINDGETIIKKLNTTYDLVQLKQEFEIWYTESFALIKVVLPDRINDFSKMYYNDKTKNGLMTYFQHIPSMLDEWGDSTIIDQVKSVLDSQIGILKSCEKRFESSLFDIKQLLQADIFDSELDAARELNKKGFLRAAGAISGVVLEGHLKQVCINHNIVIKKTNPTISDFNQLLKDNEIIETHDWRFIQRLGDIRNLCDHKKQQEPTKEEIEELIKGVEKIIKTLF